MRDRRDCLLQRIVRVCPTLTPELTSYCQGQSAGAGDLSREQDDAVAIGCGGSLVRTQENAVVQGRGFFRYPKLTERSPRAELIFAVGNNPPT